MSRWMLLVVSTLVALASAEVVSRYVAPTDYMKPMTAEAGGREVLHQRSVIPGLGYELRPGAESVTDAEHIIRINSAGMRGAEVPSDPADCTILALGDSYTFGFAVDQDEAWPAIVEQRLKEYLPTRRPRVLNMAVTGYSTRDEVLTLRHKGIAFKPDLVVVGYVLNDPETLYPWAATPLYFRGVSWWQYSNLLRLVAQAPRALGIRARGGSVVRYLHDPAGEPWQTVVTGFDDVRTLSKAHGFAVLVAIFPMVDGPDWSQYPFRDVHEQVARLAIRKGFDVTDLLDVWQRQRVLDVVVSPNDVHPNVAGHRLTGEAIAREIVSRGLAGRRCDLRSQNLPS